MELWQSNVIASIAMEVESNRDRIHRHADTGNSAGGFFSGDIPASATDWRQVHAAEGSNVTERENMNRYARLKPKTKSFLPTFADPPRWVIVRFSRDKTWSLERNAKTKRVLYWKSESSAQETMRNMARQTSKDKREIRRLYKHELAEIGANNLLLVEPVVLIAMNQPVATVDYPLEKRLIATRLHSFVRRP